MNNENITFFKPRDFSAVISDTFTWLRLNLKLLLKCFAYFAMPLFLLGGFFYAYPYSNIIFQPSSINPTSFFMGFSAALFFMIMGSLILFTTVFGIMQIQANEPERTVQPEDIWNLILNRIFIITGTGILLFLMLSLATIFFIIPGIYLYIASILTFMIVIYENKSFGEAINRSIKLTNNNWWFTFGVLFITSIIAGAISTVFIIPIYVLMIFNMVHLIENQATEINVYLTVFSAGIAVAGNALSYTIPVISTGLLYFSFREEKENPGLLEKINLMTPPANEGATA